MPSMDEPSVGVQWTIIVAALLAGIALCAWAIASGLWYLAVALILWSVVAGIRARRDGKPLYPGAGDRRG